MSFGTLQLVALGLCEQYQIVGRTLCAVEGRFVRSFGRTAGLSDEVRCNLAFLSDELLNSYRHDLLDPAITPRTLAIARSPFALLDTVVLGLGSAALLCAGGVLAWYRVPPLAAAGVMALIALPLGLASVRAHAYVGMRRAWFATLLADELLRRQSGGSGVRSGPRLTRVRTWRWRTAVGHA